LAKNFQGNEIRDVKKDGPKERKEMRQEFYVVDLMGEKSFARMRRG
jgi:hypothetical protein